MLKKCQVYGLHKMYYLKGCFQLICLPFATELYLTEFDERINQNDSLDHEHDLPKCQ